MDRDGKQPFRDQAQEAHGHSTDAVAAIGPEEVNPIQAAAKEFQKLLPKDPVYDRIEALRKEQQEIRARKKRIQMTIRNEERRKVRLRQKARKLSDEDLVQVMMLRKDYRDQRSAASAVRSAGRSTELQADLGESTAVAEAVPASSCTPQVVAQEGPDGNPSPTDSYQEHVNT